MGYIADTLGISETTEVWQKERELPYYLSDEYRFQKAVLDNQACLFICPKGDLATIPAIKKHIARLQDVEPVPVVLMLESVTAYRRGALIEDHIPFVVEKSQIYLPFMGIALRDRFASQKILTDILTPAAQLLLFHYLYKGVKESYLSEMAEALELSPMQASRAVKL
ncbi:MAG: hypothetical protein FWD72_01425, partial [Eggerthellaceae bacterium]|nr:hypothetical protein [Eggerthellaceae bacterium]